MPLWIRFTIRITAVCMVQTSLPFKSVESERRLKELVDNCSTGGGSREDGRGMAGLCVWNMTDRR